MGTSQSSSGSPSGVPMVPPWAPDPASLQEGADGDDGGADQQPAPPAPPAQVAPNGRFGPARRALGSFAHSGSTEDMRKGVGHYVRKGLGGSTTATRRLSGTTRTASALYGALSAASAGQSTADGSPFDPAVLRGRSADEVMHALVEAVRPVDGTQDTEASRFAISNALSDVLTRFPDADLLNLTDEERLFAIERYVALDVFHRFDLDVGKHLRTNAPTLSAEMTRLREVKNYVRETVAASFRKACGAAQALNVGRIGSIVRTALQEAFEVFEGYLS